MLQFRFGTSKTALEQRGAEPFPLVEPLKVGFVSIERIRQLPRLIWLVRSTGDDNKEGSVFCKLGPPEWVTMGGFSSSFS